MGWKRTDDLDPAAADAAPVVFGVGGTAYTLDLGPPNEAKLMKALQPFLTVARPYGDMPAPPEDERTVEPSAPTVVRIPPQTDRAYWRTVRAWAKGNGYNVAGSGRVSLEVIEAFTAAHS